MDKLKTTETFSNIRPEEKTRKYLSSMLLWIEQKIFFRVSKRVNWILDRVKDDTVEIVPSGSIVEDDGNWRLTISGTDLLIQKKESGVWTTKQTIPA